MAFASGTSMSPAGCRTVWMEVLIVRFEKFHGFGRPADIVTGC
jgi:hypothetical protein